MKQFLGDWSSVGYFGRFWRGLGLAVVFGAAAFAGVAEGIVRFSNGDPASVMRTVSSFTLTERAVATADGVAAATNESNVHWDLPNLDHPRVDYWVERFTTDKRGDFSRFLSRSGAYVPMISAKLEERGMPQDLIYLAMIESGFNPKAYSPAHASGLWQFIAETGQRYGLEINLAVDERNDPVKATDAALDYLTYLHGRFDSWYLAAAGYNSGENRVGRIMRQVTGSERGDESDYYRIWSHLPSETRDYVPLMVAAARITKELDRYGFGDVEMAEPLAFDEVVVDPATPLGAIAEAVGTTIAELRQLNPHFKLDRTRNDMGSPVRIPVGGASSFAANFESIIAKPAYAKAPAVAPTRQYRVRPGDNLTVIARRHNVTINQLRQANGLRGDRIRAGTTLRIPA